MILDILMGLLLLITAALFVVTSLSAEYLNEFVDWLEKRNEKVKKNNKKK